MSQNDKESEIISVKRFIDAREAATGESLEVLDSLNESPDFICRKPNGEIVGVELTQILHSVAGSEQKRVFGDDYEVDNFAIFWDGLHAVAKKDAKRRKAHWRTPNATILVLEIFDAMRLFKWPDEPEEGFDEFGFLEIWLADHSSMEAFGRISLFGIFPNENWGLNGQDYLFGKPYG
jgi:hypothetical protein